jgi:hypothetical protein
MQAIPSVVVGLVPSVSAARHNLETTLAPVNQDRIVMFEASRPETV